MNTFHPFLPPLSWTGDPGIATIDAESGSIELTAAAGVDWSNDALGGEGQHRATALVFEAPAQFALSARVTIDHERTTFDAGALVIWADADHWAKLCFEYSPQGERMIVSVVTNGYSDDCNSSVVAADSAYLRVTRTGSGWVFHDSTDGDSWRFVRLFRLDTDAPVSVGFLAQAPFGDRCVATFDHIALSEQIAGDFRDGS